MAEDRIEYADFTAVDMRAGTVVEVLDFPRARTPSYKVRVDFGADIGDRWSSVQAATDYPDGQALVGVTVVGVVNLPPRNIAGFQSQVLILGAPGADGGLSLLVPSRPAQAGGRVY